MGEINFWRDRNASLSPLYEQLRMEHVSQVLRVLEFAHSHSLDLFKV